MAGYIVRRLMSAVLVIILTSMFVFTLFFLGPTDQADVLCNQNGRCTADRKANIVHAMGLDKSVVTNYGEFVGGLFHDRKVSYGATYDCHAPCFGISYSTRAQVTDELKQYYPATLSLAIGGAIIYLVVGVVTGSLAARWRGTVGDRFLVSSSLLISSIPYYLVCLVAWIYLDLKWSVFPETGYNAITHGLGPWFGGLLLPWLVLGLANSTQYTRFTRGSMVETLGEDYIRTAVAKGAKSRTVIFKHGLRAAIAPVLTIFGLDFAALLAGTIFTEQIFDINGIGRLSINSIRSPIDFPVLTATVLISAGLVVVGNLVVDILYVFVDPRVRLG